MTRADTTSAAADKGRALRTSAVRLGARAVCIGRPYLWGLGAFGQPGVESVLSLLRAELEVVMRQMGTPTLSEINPNSLGRHRG